jgi:hypothetical protein
MCDEIESERLDKLHRAFFEHNETLCQTLGQALGYPWFKDDPINFPGATVEHGVCVGDHGAESLAAEAAARLRGFGQIPWSRLRCSFGCGAPPVALICLPEDCAVPTGEQVLPGEQVRLLCPQHAISLEGQVTLALRPGWEP